MSDREDSPEVKSRSPSVEQDAGEVSDEKEEQDAKTSDRSRSGSPATSNHEGSKSRSRSRSVRKHRSRSRSGSRRRRSRSRSGSHYRRRHSRSRSPYYRRHRSRSRDSYRQGYRRSRSRSPLSRRRRHAGNRDNPGESTCLGIFGLSLYTQERDLREVFSRFGPVEECQVVYDHNTGRSRGFGFVYMRNIEDAVEAKERAAGTEIDGRRIRVDYSITQRAHTPTPGVYLGKTTSSGYKSGGSYSGYSGGYKSDSPHYRSRYRSRSRSRGYSPRRY